MATLKVGTEFQKRITSKKQLSLPRVISIQQMQQALESSSIIPPITLKQNRDGGAPTERTYSERVGRPIVAPKGEAALKKYLCDYEKELGCPIICHVDPQARESLDEYGIAPSNAPHMELDSQRMVQKIKDVFNDPTIQKPCVFIDFFGASADEPSHKLVLFLHEDTETKEKTVSMPLYFEKVTTDNARFQTLKNDSEIKFLFGHNNEHGRIHSTEGCLGLQLAMIKHLIEINAITNQPEYMSISKKAKDGRYRLPIKNLKLAQGKIGQILNNITEFFGDDVYSQRELDYLCEKRLKYDFKSNPTDKGDRNLALWWSTIKKTARHYDDGEARVANLRQWWSTATT